MLQSLTSCCFQIVAANTDHSDGVLSLLVKTLFRLKQLMQTTPEKRNRGKSRKEKDIPNLQVDTAILLQLRGGSKSCVIGARLAVWCAN